MSDRRTTLKDVAVAAGVSTATVSRVFSGSKYVSPEIRASVERAAGQLGYRVNAVARSMRTGRSLAVGYVVSDITNPLFASIAKGMDEILTPKGYSLVLANSGGDPGREEDLIESLLDRQVDGLVLSAADETAPRLRAMLRRFRASVLLDREIDGATDAVVSDHRVGMDQAVGHLRSLGHERIALIAGSRTQRGGRNRVQVFAEAMGDALDPQLVHSEEFSSEAGYLATGRLLRSPRPPTALVVGSNMLVVGVLEALRDAGTQIPRDLSLVACDDIDLTRLHAPPIDVIDRDMTGLGRTAIDLLLARLAAPDAPFRIKTLPTRFEARGSSGAPSAPAEEAPA